MIFQEIIPNMWLEVRFYRLGGSSLLNFQVVYEVTVYTRISCKIIEQTKYEIYLLMDPDVLLCYYVNYNTRIYLRLSKISQESTNSVNERNRDGIWVETETETEIQ